MLSFESDYIMGAHPRILQRLSETNFDTQSGYGVDEYSVSAKKKIAEACQCESADVEFLVGGTQTNLTVISTMLKPFEGVIAAETGHVSLHEAGAIEYTGHKVLTLKQNDGKIDAAILKEYLVNQYADENFEHMVIPGMVYISHPTEYGTLYTKKELIDIASVCREYNLPLFLDGARLGYGLMSDDTDVALCDIARLCDVFYIGGTKVGALCGEAVVFTKNNKPAHFVNQLKKRGALLAKGRLIGVQFDTLFTDNLYFDISKNAINMAKEIKKALVNSGFKMFIDSPTNQQFVIMPNSKIHDLKQKVGFAFWEKYDDNNTVVRFASSWATTKKDIEQLKNALKSL